MVVVMVSLQLVATGATILYWKHCTGSKEKVSDLFGKSQLIGQARQQSGPRWIGGIARPALFPCCFTFDGLYRLRCTFGLAEQDGPLSAQRE
jgi:hypothetical protein